MKEPSIDKLLKKVPNKYILTVLASKRARQINEELKFLRQIMAKDVLTLALEEIINDKVTYEEEEL
ncbi:MAG: DNA-directed RNA polymerase subunit omega [Dictyoglomus sp.]|nr:DNA-directed RNA polymerase subunit omega [Dictyoglomus sp.]MCX7942561.1 DNA-directed RNA polymerase subunit omega [Dictyoglomaceae bacterium]MDW8188799.1 DNA-directed RNA polymerase subunit omega [Dictyoglomus sp.]